jgi:hypothetical protein
LFSISLWLCTVWSYSDFNISSCGLLICYYLLFPCTLLIYVHASGNLCKIILNLLFSLHLKWYGCVTVWSYYLIFKHSSTGNAGAANYNLLFPFNSLIIDRWSKYTFLMFLPCSFSAVTGQHFHKFSLRESLLVDQILFLVCTRLVPIARVDQFLQYFVLSYLTIFHTLVEWWVEGKA